MGRQLRDLRESVMRVRMVQIGEIFERMTFCGARPRYLRTVRILSCSKAVVKLRFDKFSGRADDGSLLISSAMPSVMDSKPSPSVEPKESEVKACYR